MKIKSLLCRTDKRRESSRIRIETLNIFLSHKFLYLNKRIESNRIRIETELPTIYVSIKSTIKEENPVE